MYLYMYYTYMYYIYICTIYIVLYIYLYTIILYILTLHAINRLYVYTYYIYTHTIYVLYIAIYIIVAFNTHLSVWVPTSGSHSSGRSCSTSWRICDNFSDGCGGCAAGEKMVRVTGWFCEDEILLGYGILLL